MKQRFKILFLIGLLIVSASAAVADPHVFVPLHWVLGSVDAPAGNPDIPVDGCTVVFYRENNPNDTITTQVAAGKYVINTYSNSAIPINYQDNYFIMVTGADGFGVEQSFQLTKGEGFKRIDLILEALPTTGGLKGSVVDVNGDPIPNGTPLDITVGAIGYNTMVTDDAGYFEIWGIPPGIYDEITITATIVNSVFEGKVENVTIVVGQWTIIGPITLFPEIDVVITYPDNVQISRHDTDNDNIDDAIKLTWGVEIGKSPLIGILVGDGTGQYQNGTQNSDYFGPDDPAGVDPHGKWIDGSQLENIAAINLDYIGDNVDNGELIIKDQVGGEGNLPDNDPPWTYHKEIYLKVLYVEGGEPSFEQIVANVPGAKAVGKMDILFPAAKTFFSMPLETTGGLNDILGNVFVNGSVLFEHDYINKGFKTSSLLNGSWSGNDIPTITRDKGYYLQNMGAEKTVTFVGEVVDLSVLIVINPNKNLIGDPFPGSLSLTTFNMDLGDNRPKVGDVILKYNKDENGFDPNSYLNIPGQGETWQYSDQKINTGLSYWYQRSGSKNLDWQPNKPWQ